MSKSIWSLVCAASLACGVAVAQQPAPLTPKTQPKPTPQTGTVPDPAEVAFTEQLKAMVIVGAENEIRDTDPMADATGVQVLGPEFLTRYKIELARDLADFFGKRVTTNTIKIIQTNLIRFVRRYDTRILDVVYVPQRSITEGVLQLAVVEARALIDPQRQNLPELRGVLIVGNPKEIKSRGGVGALSGVKILGPPFLEGQEAGLQLALKDFLGKPFSGAKIDDLRAAISAFIDKIQGPVASVILPEQEIAKEEWVVQVLVAQGEIGRLNIQNPDRKWFSDARIRSRLRMRQGDPVIVDRLVDDINWINRNPFREADVKLQQGKQLGQVDVNVSVDDRFPLQGFAGVEDSLPETLDRYMWFAGVNWGRAFGLDHLLNYQFAAGFNFDAINSHSASYIAPLPWRHVLTLGGAYAEFEPDLSAVGPLLTSQGKTYQVNGAYSVPMRWFESYFHEVSLGFDYKYTDNNLLFGQSSAGQSPTEIAQFIGSYEGLALDRWGGTRFQLRGVYSPGDLFGHNTDEDFTGTHTGAEANYYFFRVSGERVTKLPFHDNWRQRDASQGFSIAVSGLAQLSESKLLPSEQIVFGGYDSVRGYDEFSTLSDEGWRARAELRSPEFAFGGRRQLVAPEAADQKAEASDPKRALRLQLLGFFDYGRIEGILQSALDTPEQQLMSVGGGLRGGWSRFLNFRFDYGFQIGDEVPGQDEHRGHFSVVATF